jgi:hypothetical protein
VETIVNQAVESRGPGVVDLLKQALELYRRHARAFLITAAALFVPGSFISSCALSATLRPLTEHAASFEDVSQRVAERSQALSRRMQEQAKRGGALDPKVLAEMAKENEENWQEMGRASGSLATLVKRGLTIVLGLFACGLFALFLYCLVLPLTQGALTVAVADRMQGGTGSWREHWAVLLRFKRPLLSALVPAAFLGVLGSFFFLLPGMLIGFFFSFVSPVVLIEGLAGQAALKRSYALVRADWRRVALVMSSFVGLNLLTRVLVALIVPNAGIFFSTFLGDLISLVIMPVPIILSSLLYLDIRRICDGATREQLAEELAALRLAQ